MGVFHSEEEKRRDLEAYEEAQRQKALKGKKMLWVVVIWDAVFAILNGFAISQGFLSAPAYTIFTYILRFLIIFQFGCYFVALDLAVLLGGWSWARLVRSILAFIITFCGFGIFLYFFALGHFILALSFIGNLFIGLLLFGSRSVQKYIELKGKVR